MTELLYHTDAYLQEFDANVTTALPDERAVVLDRTAFYPGGGGQPCDFGSLNINGVVYTVDKVKKQGDNVLHFLSGTSPLPSIGSASRGTLDWARRHKLMRTHTALHVLCGTVFRDYGALVTGGDMEPLKGRMDFEFATMRGDLVREIELAVNKEVAEAREIRVNINLLPEGISHVRTIEIVGLDLQADGGTHVRNTNEVGKIRVVDYKSKGAINKRIYIEIE
jgi:misacylated tRNA(Ala) deacylase